MRKERPCWTPSTSPSVVPGKGRRAHGQESAHREAAAQAQVQGPGLHPMPAVWPLQGRLPSFRPVPDLPPGDGPCGRDPRRHEELLVGTTMTMTDPIADMLTRIRNGNVAMHDEVVMPSSKLKEALAAILEREGYISGFRVDGDTGHPGRKLIVAMKYTPERRRTITGIKRVSKPGLRVYSKADSVGRVLGGMAVAILSTNQGLLTDREARQRRVGGEVLCHVWEARAMSRIGRKPSPIPSGVEVTLNGAHVVVKGPK